MIWYNYSSLKLLDHVKKGIKNVVVESLLAIANKSLLAILSNLPSYSKKTQAQLAS